MAKLKISDKAKLGKQEILLDPTKHIQRCGGDEVDALILNDLMYRQEDGTYVPAVSLMSGFISTISKVTATPLQAIRKATVAWEGNTEVTFIPPTDPNAVTVTRTDHTLQVDVVDGFNTVQIKGKDDKVYTSVGFYVYSEAEISAIALAAGYSSPADVATQIANAKEDSLAESQGYVDVVDMKIHSATDYQVFFEVDMEKTPLAKKIKYEKLDGTVSDTYDLVVAPDGKKSLGRSFYANNLYKSLIVLAGNNKEIDRLDVNFSISTLPTPPIPTPTVVDFDATTNGDGTAMVSISGMSDVDKLLYTNATNVVEQTLNPSADALFTAKEGTYVEFWKGAKVMRIKV